MKRTLSLSFRVKDDQSYRESYADVLWQIATECYEERFEEKIKLLKRSKITPWLDLQSTFCFLTGVRRNVIKEWLTPDGSHFVASFRENYENVKSFIEARLASGLLGNTYKRDVLETIMWWKYRERISPPKEVEQKNSGFQVSLKNAGFFALEKEMMQENDGV